MRNTPLNLLPSREEQKAIEQKPLVRREKKNNDAAVKASNKASRKLSVTLENDMIVIRMPVFAAPTASASGKSMLYGSTRGPKRVMQEIDGKFEPAVIDGGKLKAIASAFVTLEAKKK